MLFSELLLSDFFYVSTEQPAGCCHSWLPLQPHVLAQLAATAGPVPPGLPPAHTLASAEHFGLQAAANINPVVTKPKTEE